MMDRQEIMQLRNMKPQVGERRDALSIPPERDFSGIVPPNFYLARPGASAAAATNDEEEKAQETIQSDNSDDSGAEKEEVEENADGDKVEEEEAQADGIPADLETTSDDKQSDDSTADDDSDQAVGLEEAAEQDRDLMDDDDASSDDETPNNEKSSMDREDIVEELDASSDSGSPNKTEKVTTMFQKILSLGTPKGQVVVSRATDHTGQAATPQGAAPIPPEADMSSGPDARLPTVTHNGRMVRATNDGDAFIFCDIPVVFKLYTLHNLTTFLFYFTDLQSTGSSGACWRHGHCRRFNRSRLDGSKRRGFSCRTVPSRWSDVPDEL